MIKTMEKTIKLESGPYLESFERFEKEAKNPAWVFPIRKAGFARFAELGFPTLQHEDWRFTNVAPIAKLPFKPAFEPPSDKPDADRIASLTFGKLPAWRLVFINAHSDAQCPSSTPQ